MNLDTPISDLVGVGPVYVNRLKKLDIVTVNDLINHYPFRYEDYSVTTPAASAQVGETVTVRGTIHSAQNDFTRNGKKMQKVQLFDGTGSMLLVFFNQPYLMQSLKPGLEMAASGEVKFFGKNKAIIGPEYEMIYDRDPIHTGRLVPVYPETAGVSSKWIRSKIALLIKRVSKELEEFLPYQIQSSQQLIDYQKAIEQIHFPDNQSSANQARERLAFDEMFLTLLASKIRKEQWKEEKMTHSLSVTDQLPLISEFISNLPFELTGAQKKSVDEILLDLNRSKPMNRLLQGDVGSGKTVVATIAMYATHLAGYKSALMAPTEILANQHYETIKKLLEPYGLKIAIQTGSKKQLNSETMKQSSVIIGTHALLYHQEFENLALVVIDEQHRFGVEQRGKLKQQGIHPHLLSMTATPIPRSFALVLHSELDLSYIDEMPHGRKPIKTWLVSNDKREKAYSWMREQIKQTDNQAFVICPLIHESEHDTLQSVKAASVEYDMLKNKVFPDLELGLIHGKIKPREKEKMLHNMAENKLDILVATPVVEVGIDIPNATIMVIEAADRFGLAQMHQLRGRVGRSDKQSYCLLFTESTSEKTNKRLRYLESVNNGAALSEIDMKLRGPGDIFGTRQSGFSDFKLATLTDTALIRKARDGIDELNRLDPIFGLRDNPSNDMARLRKRVQNYIIRSVNPD